MVAVALLLFAAASFQRPDSLATVRGVVLDAESGDTLAAWIAAAGADRGVRTDARGRFVLRLPPGARELRVRSLGHRDRRLSLVLRAGQDSTIAVELAAVATSLAAIRTVAARAERQRFADLPDVGIVALAESALGRLPAVGEGDLLRALATLPGATARNDYMAGVNVRGGEADQNLVLLDGIPVHNPFHLGGLFGTFVDDAVGTIALATAAFPASVGGRLSSVLDVTSQEEPRTGVHGTGELSLLATTVTLGGALPGAGQSWNLAARRTYVDVVAGALTSESLPYHFHDVQFHGTTRLPASGTLALTAYSGRDAAVEPDAARDDPPVGSTDTPFRFGWGNDLAGLTWTQPAGGRTSLVHRVHMSRFGAALVDDRGALVLRSVVLDLGASGRLTTTRRWGSIAAGWEASRHRMRYRERVGPDATGLPWGSDEPASDTLVRQAATSGALWTEALVRRGALRVRPGLRAEAADGAGWLGVSPRVTAKLFVRPATALTAGASRHVQLLHAVRNEDLPIRIFDVWLLSRDGIPPSRAVHLVGGVEHWWRRDGWMVRAEGWQKRYADLPEPASLRDPRVRPALLREFDGRSYGADVFLRRFERGGLGGWLTYGYAVSRRQRGGEVYAPAQDRRHNANLVVAWRPAARWSFGGRVAVASGTPFTPVTGWMPALEWDPSTGQWRAPRPGRRDRIDVPGDRNSARYPLYARIDASAERTWFPSPQTALRGYLSLVNVTNRRNVFLYDFDVRGEPPRTTAYSQFPILPTLGVKVEF